MVTYKEGIELLISMYITMGSIVGCLYLWISATCLELIVNDADHRLKELAQELERQRQRLAKEQP